MRTPASDPREHDDPQEREPIDPAEGLPDMRLPGADRPAPIDDPDPSLPERLAERIGGEPGGLVAGEPDLLPNVEVPDAQM
jgi:hypothetical protein